jgi:hypothetical protein
LDADVREQLRRRVDEAQRARNAVKTATHNAGGYVMGCRCRVCSAAMLAYNRERRAKAAA